MGDPQRIDHINSVVFGNFRSGFYMTHYGPQGNSRPPISKMRLPSTARTSLAKSLMKLLMTEYHDELSFGDWKEHFTLTLFKEFGELHIVCALNTDVFKSERQWGISFSEGVCMHLIKLLIPAENDTLLEFPKTIFTD